MSALIGVRAGQSDAILAKSTSKISPTVNPNVADAQATRHPEPGRYHFGREHAAAMPNRLKTLLSSACV